MAAGRGDTSVRRCAPQDEAMGGQLLHSYRVVQNVSAYPSCIYDSMSYMLKKNSKKKQHTCSNAISVCFTGRQRRVFSHHFHEVSSLHLSYYTYTVLFSVWFEECAILKISCLVQLCIQLLH